MSSSLVSVPEAQQLLAAGPVTVIDVRWQLSAPGAPAASLYPEYLSGHLPGAIFVDVEDSLTGTAGVVGGRHPLPSPEVFEAAMRAAGVRDDVPVLVYDQGDSMAAGRLWWLLTDAGHPTVRVLNGGLTAWRAQDGDLDEGPVQAEPSTWVAHPGSLPVVDAEDIRYRIDLDLIDVRTPERFRGEVEPIDPIAGHIPGARNLPVHTLKGADGTILDPQSLRLTVGDIAPGTVLYCGSGITASLAMLALDSAGYQGLVLYPGSWSDWLSRGGSVDVGLDLQRPGD